MQRAFRAVDSDGSGRIEMNELRYLIAVHLNIDAEDELLEFIFHCLDRGDKGSITYSEFTSALEGPLSSKPGTTTLELQVCRRKRVFTSGSFLALSSLHNRCNGHNRALSHHAARRAQSRPFTPRS